MPTYSKAPAHVVEMANAVLCEFETHKPLLDAKIRIDYLVAFGDEKTPAITHRGQPARGLCRKMSLKDRVAGRGDAEIIIDGDWWKDASADERRALLDHELHHIEIPDLAERDDHGRPKIRLRKHDVEIGWFSVIADRHGEASGERQQAKAIFDLHGQSFWPGMLAVK